MNKLLVIGSTNVDLTFVTNEIPSKGETIFGEEFNLSLGGKGLNQAYNALNCFENTKFISAVGDDFFADYVLKSLEAEGVDTSYISKISNCETGLAQITLNNNDNRIIVIKGANNEVNDKLIDFNCDLLSECAYVLIQNEVNLSAIKYICNNKHKYNYKIIYNPAPYIYLDKKYIAMVDYITPNETEYELLLKDHGTEFDDKMIITRGATGIEYNGQIYAAPSVNVVDTTGAGDAFNGTFSSLLANGYTLEDAIKIAVKCASYSVTTKGAHTKFDLKDFEVSSR